MYDLDWLIEPFSSSDFFASVWQKKPLLLSQNRSNKFDGFFGVAELENVLEYGQPKPPSIRLASARADEKVEPPFLGNGRLNIDRIRKYYVSGQTVILNNLEDFDANIGSLIQSLQKDTGYRVQVNSYLTPPTSQGFKPHYDTHDVLVVQIEGEKNWKVYGADTACPLNELTDGGAIRLEPDSEATEINLKAGDVLYIPRGWIHEAETAGKASLHLTLGIHPPLARDMLASALEIACRLHPAFREPLPRGFAGEPGLRAELQAQFDRVLALFSDTADMESAVQVIEEELVRRGRSGGDGHLFSDMNTLDTLDAGSELERRPHMPNRMIRTTEGVGLQFGASVVEGPEQFADAMRMVADASQPFRVSDLPGLDPDHQLALATSLLTEGLCRLTNSELQESLQ